MKKEQKPEVTFATECRLRLLSFPNITTALNSQSRDRTRQICLCGTVFADALLLQQCFSGGIGRLFCAVGVNLFGTLGAVYEDEDFVVLDLDQSGGNCGDFGFFPRNAVGHGAGDDGADDVAVPGEDAVLPARGGDDE